MKAKGTLVVFICNHCPYVKTSISRIVAEAKALREIGIGTIDADIAASPCWS
jgi:hypothetical protein